jgi:hypothetical protein
MLQKQALSLSVAVTHIPSTSKTNYVLSLLI